MSLDEACAGGAGDEATEEGEVIPPTQEDVDMPSGEDTEEGEGMPPTQEDVDMPPAEDTAAESSNVKQQATSASAGKIGESF